MLFLSTKSHNAQYVHTEGMFISNYAQKLIGDTHYSSIYTSVYINKSYYSHNRPWELFIAWSLDGVCLDRRPPTGQ